MGTVNDAAMAAKKKKPPPPPCVHVQVEMLAYIAGECVGPHAGDHTAVLWCVDCGAVIKKAYLRGGEVQERVRLPSRAR